ncbi:MAG: LytR C-terminal domain-containing protein, partial [Chthoniobacterales bacterium]
MQTELPPPSVEAFLQKAKRRERRNFVSRVLFVTGFVFFAALFLVLAFFHTGRLERSVATEQELAAAQLAAGETQLLEMERNRKEAIKTIDKIAERVQKDPDTHALVETAKEQLTNAPHGPVVYPHTAIDYQQGDASKVSEKLREAGYNIPEIRKINGSAPFPTEVRFFRSPEDAPTAAKLAKILQNDCHIPYATTRLIKGWSGDRRPTHLEIFFASDAFRTDGQVYLYVPQDKKVETILNLSELQKEFAGLDLVLITQPTVLP